jgi:hypothetical protein
VLWAQIFGPRTENSIGRICVSCTHKYILTCHVIEQNIRKKVYKIHNAILICMIFTLFPFKSISNPLKIVIFIILERLRSWHTNWKYLYVCWNILIKGNQWSNGWMHFFMQFRVGICCACTYLLKGCYQWLSKKLSVCLSLGVQHQDY